MRCDALVPIVFIVLQRAEHALPACIARTPYIGHSITAGGVEGWSKMGGVGVGRRPHRALYAQRRHKGGVAREPAGTEAVNGGGVSL